MTAGDATQSSADAPRASRWLFRIGLLVVVVGFIVQMFSGYTYTVAKPEDCPDTWEGDEVTSTEVYDRSGNPAGYWCLVPGSFTQTNEPRFHNIPVGDRAGYAQWYGFAVMLVGAGMVGIALLLNRSSTDSTQPGNEPDEEADD